MRPEEVWCVDEAHRDDYRRTVAVGREVAGQLSAAIVAIARNAMPLLDNTLPLIHEVREGFRQSGVYVFENDSTDGTAERLDREAAARPGFVVEHETLGGLDSRGFEPERTERLAYCRNKCHNWVRKHAHTSAWTIVVDVDPEHGFSPDGVFHSIGKMAVASLGCGNSTPGAMASYSLFKVFDDTGKPRVAHYDSWAARPLCWWDDRREEVGFGWFSMFLPPVGAPVMPMNSAFGGLCVYKTEAYLAAGERPYEGGDCEHVFLHKKMRQAGYQLYLNPGSRYIAIWR